VILFLGSGDSIISASRTIAGNPAIRIPNGHVQNGVGRVPIHVPESLHDIGAYLRFAAAEAFKPRFVSEAVAGKKSGTSGFDLRLSVRVNPDQGPPVRQMRRALAHQIEHTKGTGGIRQILSGQQRRQQRVDEVAVDFQYVARKPQGLNGGYAGGRRDGRDDHVATRQKVDGMTKSRVFAVENCFAEQRGQNCATVRAQR
jgi:hypothetical protein